MVELIRVSPAMDTARVSRRWSSTIWRNISPVSEPAVNTGTLWPPSVLITRETLTPPPPGNFTGWEARSFCTGSMCSISHWTSTLEFRVSVAMVFMTRLRSGGHVGKR